MIDLGLQDIRCRIVIAGHALPGLRHADRTARIGATRGRHRSIAGLRHMADLGQHAGADQFRVDLFVDRVETRHHVAIEQLVDDQLDLDVDIELMDRDAERVAEYGGADWIVRIVDLGAADQYGKALVDLIKRALQPIFSLRDHAGYSE